jgi:hypothetical protein
MKSEMEITPTLLTPEMVAKSWCVSVKTVYGWVNTGKLPHVLLPTDGKHKRLIRIRAVVAESWVLEHEVNGATQNQVIQKPRYRRRSILQPPKGVTVIKPLENGGKPASDSTENS